MRKDNTMKQKKRNELMKRSENIMHITVELRTEPTSISLMEKKLMNIYHEADRIFMDMRNEKSN